MNCIFVVSDDNSSVQSSPWQRDHCWKQASPRHHAARGLEFMISRPRSQRRLKHTPKGVRRKRRRPYDTSSVDWNDKSSVKSTNGRSALGINTVS